jgi:DNA helicase II / ATP-dependent DNA helicase PcrA
LNEFYDQISLFASETEDGKKDKKGVKVFTIHSSKGLEFDYVFLPGWIKGKVPMLYGNFKLEEIEEERRIAFVGLTRARKFVQISFFKNKVFSGW